MDQQYNPHGPKTQGSSNSTVLLLLACLEQQDCGETGEATKAGNRTVMGAFNYQHAQWANPPLGHSAENKPQTISAAACPKGENTTLKFALQGTVQHVTLKWQPEHS